MGAYSNTPIQVRPTRFDQNMYRSGQQALSDLGRTLGGMQARRDTLAAQHAADVNKTEAAKLVADESARRYNIGQQQKNDAVLREKKRYENAQFEDSYSKFKAQADAGMQDHMNLGSKGNYTLPAEIAAFNERNAGRENFVPIVGAGNRSKSQEYALRNQVSKGALAKQARENAAIDARLKLSTLKDNEEVEGKTTAGLAFKSDAATTEALKEEYNALQVAQDKAKLDSGTYVKDEKTGNIRLKNEKELKRDFQRSQPGWDEVDDGVDLSNVHEYVPQVAISEYLAGKAGDTRDFLFGTGKTKGELILEKEAKQKEKNEGTIAAKRKKFMEDRAKLIKDNDKKYQGEIDTLTSNLLQGGLGENYKVQEKSTHRRKAVDTQIADITAITDAQIAQVPANAPNRKAKIMGIKKEAVNKIEAVKAQSAAIAAENLSMVKEQAIYQRDRRDKYNDMLAKFKHSKELKAMGATDGKLEDAFKTMQLQMKLQGIDDVDQGAISQYVKAYLQGETNIPIYE